MYYKKQQKEQPKSENKIHNMFWKCEYDDGTVKIGPDLESASIDYYTEQLELNKLYPDKYSKPKPVYMWDLDMKISAIHAARPQSSKDMKCSPILVREFRK
jgi:hypothetical protein